MTAEWKSFDYNNPPEPGIYWFKFRRPVYDCDIDADGKPIGIPTGEVEGISLARLEIWDGGPEGKDWPQCYFEAVDHYNFGEVEDEYTAIEYAEVKSPFNYPTALDDETKRMVLELCDTIIIGSIFGIITKAKKIRELLEAGA